MTAITTGGSGNFNSTTPNAPWPGGTLPVDGDTITVAAGHTVTVPGGYTTPTLGNSAVYGGTGSPAITTAGTGTLSSLIIAGTLRTFGAIVQTNRPIEGSAGGIVEFDKGTHGSGITWQVGTANAGTNSKIIGSTGGAAPTPANPFTIQGTAGQGNPGHTITDGAFTECCQVDIQALRLNRMGSSSVVVFSTRISATGDIFRITWGIADTCGQIVNCNLNLVSGCIYDIGGAAGGGGGFTIRNSVTAATAIGLHVRSNVDASITGTRRFNRIRSDRQIKIFGNLVSLTDIVVDLGSTSLGAIDSSSATSGLAVANKIVTRSGMATSPTMALNGGETLTNFYAVNQGGLNPRWWGLGSAKDASINTTTITDGFIQRAGGDALGDSFVKSVNPAAVQTYVFRRYVMLHNALDRTQQSAKIVSPLGDPSNERYDIEHCTWMSNVSAVETGVQVGEASTTDVGQIWNSIRSNIAWSPGTSLTDRWVFRQITGNAGFVQPTPLTAANVDYNGKFNLASDGTNPAGYKSANNGALVASGTLGAHDVVGDPQFVDQRLRDIGLWHYDHIGGTITGNEQAALDGAFAAMMLANDQAGYDSFYEIAGSPTALIPWVTAGYAPTASAYNTTYAGDTSTFQNIGSAAGVFGGGGGGASGRIGAGRLSMSMGLGV